jgi:ABC-type uncharacterized transport system involved in gliding motility auxiliary subunit
MALSTRRRVERWNAWLTAALLLCAVVLGNRVARRHLVVRHDFSEDQLFAVTPQARSILARLEDVLQVKTYFTADVKSGEVALAKARVEAQLEELHALSGGRMTVVAQDPSRSTEAQIDAASFGIQPRGSEVRHGTGVVRQPVYLGLLLRYRGRSEVLSFVDPWSFEAQFVGAVHRLLQDRRAVVGWYGEPFEPTLEEKVFGTFAGARKQLGARYEVREVQQLADGEPVPGDVEILFVVRPVELHPRAVFELDQFVQRGGRLVVLVDQARMCEDFRYPRARHAIDGNQLPPTGLEALLRAWGAPVLPYHAWDTAPGRAGERYWVVPEIGPDGAPTGQGMKEPVRSPALVRVTGAGLSRAFPPTAPLSIVQLPWAQVLAAAQPPDGVVRTDYLFSSDEAYAIEPLERLTGDAGAIEGMTATLHADATRSRERLPLACVLAGRFPTPFTRGAPAPRDPFAREGAPATTDEAVLDRAADSTVIVVADADWMRDPDAAGLFPFAADDGRLLLDNLVDWLTRDDELIALRSRVPRNRPLRDFLAEEREREGLVRATLYDTDAERREQAEGDARAERRAGIRRWRAMLLPVGASLLLVLALGAAVRVLGRRDV